MLTAIEKTEYLEEIREQVCSRCVEKPPGGPPCEPLGKFCGIELHLPELVESIHQVHSPLMALYLEHNRNEICSRCAHVHSSLCPCPMDYLAVLVVQAIETVDQRRQQTEQQRNLAEPQEGHVPDPAAIARAYDNGAGTWTGCDWPTHFGNTGLNLNGWTADEAEGMSLVTVNANENANWQAAARWLSLVERRAQEAEAKAAAAVNASGAGRWDEALSLAEWAVALEFSTGRPLRGLPLSWKGLCAAIEAGYLAHKPEACVPLS
jgi:hypothetical protein